MATCWMQAGCANPATTYLIAPEGGARGSRYCDRHAAAARDEYREKLGEVWTILSERDAEIIDERARSYETNAGPRVGDFVRFADGVVRRASHVWPADWHDDMVARVQTSDGGSYYLGAGDGGLIRRSGPAYISYSGSLYEGVRADALTLTDERREGRVWIFHEDHWGAGRGVDASILFRVYDCSLPAPR